MSQMLFNMAQQAAQDSSLMAGLIDKYTRQTGTTWADVAIELQLSPSQLAKLALCRQPNGNAHQETRQIADYVKMSPIVLSHFYERAQNGVAVTAKTTPPKKTAETKLKNPPQRSYSPSNRLMPKRLAWTMSAALALLLIISVFALAQPTAVSEATLVVSSGEVIVNRSGGALTGNKSITAVSGEVLVVGAGDLLTTNAAAVAELRLADGGVVELAENTTVEITHLVTTEETYQVTLTMMAGRTLNRVVRLLGVDDTYQVRTPSSTASVRGTVFTVDILSANSTYVAVDEGVVQVSMGDQAVDVKAGFEVTAVLGERLTVKPQNQPEPLPPPAPKVEPAPAATTLPPTPTTEPALTAEPKSAEEKSGQKASENAILLPMLDATPTTPPEPIPGVIGDIPVPGGSDNPIPNPAPDGSDSGGNPHDGMTVPGSPPSDPGDGSPPAGGAVPPGQGGTPPGQISNPGQGGEKKDD